MHLLKAPFFVCKLLYKNVCSLSVGNGKSFTQQIIMSLFTIWKPILGLKCYQKNRQQHKRKEK